MNAQDDLLQKLKTLSQSGPIPSVREGPTGVGVTLLDALGLDLTSVKKGNYKGIVIKAVRRNHHLKTNRVNLFAQVPDWNISACKSSKEILQRFGYETQGGRCLNCTVNSLYANSQGLRFQVRHSEDILAEIHSGSQVSPVAAWRITKLRERFIESNPNVAYVFAKSVFDGQQECFHYRTATFSGKAEGGKLIEALEDGIVTMDHLITDKGSGVREKGPLFKINPSNVRRLFAEHSTFDLMSV